MALSKQQMMGAVGGGVFVLCAGVLGWLLYSAWSERSEAETSLADETDTYRNYHSEKVFPSKTAIDTVNSNRACYAEWYTNAMTFVSRGDRVFESKNGSDFKDEMLKVVRRLADLSGGAAGKIVMRDSIEANFGFEEYLGDNGKIPNDEDVPRLTVQLDTIRAAVELFAEAGVMQVNSVQRIAPKVEEDEDDRGSAKKNKKKKGNGKTEPQDDDAAKRMCLEYVFEVTTRPAGFVAMLNKFTACERFCVLKDLEFKESGDMILERIAAAENAAAQQKKAAEAGTSGRRRRRGGLEAPAENPAQKQKADRVVIDPELDHPLNVKFKLAVYDFGRGVAAAEAPAAEVEKKDEAKSVEGQPAAPQNEKKEAK